MINITNENYYDDNKGLSQSKIKDFLSCHNYFYRKNIAKTVVQESKKAFEIGKCVDNILTEADSVDNYAVFNGDRRTKDGKAQYQDLIDSGKNVLSQKDYDDIINIADSVIKTSAYNSLLKESYVFQEILQIEADLGEHFDSYYGKPDAYKIFENGVCRLVDIKTAVNVDDRSFYYKADEYGYFTQFWYYAFLLRRKYPQITSFEYYILAQEKNEPYTVKLFTIPNDYVDSKESVVVDAINQIIKLKEFKKADASFEFPSILKRPGSTIEL